jgi:UDP-3-O-[3-hydroxymyristoyl] N-acetylglucosamine deacetylase
MQADRQTTLRAATKLEGHGVHSGSPASITIRPASANQGYVFIRKGMPDGVDRVIRARFDGVTATALCTVLGNPEEAAVATVEHLLSAFYGLGLDNVIIEIGGPEMPIMDGSSAMFVDAIMATGITRLAETRRYIKVLKTVRTEEGQGFAELQPWSEGFKLDVEIDFESPVIGRQRRVFVSEQQAYQRDISRARTFGFMRDVEMLWKMGFALGASLDNTVAVGEDKIVNPEGLRYTDEFVRHKILDAIGDLALAGMPILGSFRSYRGGHKLNNNVLRALFADRSNYEIVEGKTIGEMPAVAEPVRSLQMSASMPAAAFAPNTH